MFALHLRQQQSSGNTFEYFERRRTSPSLFQPRVPGHTDVRALRDFFTTKSRRATTGQAKSKGPWLNPLTATFQKIAERFTLEST
jgi:hypothetical protein